MLYKTHLLTLSFTLFSLTAAAAVYKCEVDGVTTFSQIPCGDSYQEIDVSASIAPTKQLGSGESMQACLAHIKKTNAFKYPDSLKVTDSYTQWSNDKSGARNILVVYADTKNAEGAYMGTERYQCFMSFDGSTLSNVQYLVN